MCDIYFLKFSLGTNGKRKPRVKWLTEVHMENSQENGKEI